MFDIENKAILVSPANSIDILFSDSVKQLTNKCPLKDNLELINKMSIPNRSYNLALISALLFAFAVINGAAVLNKKALDAEQQAELDFMADSLISKVKSTMDQADFERVSLLNQATRSVASPLERLDIQFVIGRQLLPKVLARIMRLELGAFYLGQKEIDQQLFEQTLNGKLIAPCKQLDSILNGWWQKASEGHYAKKDNKQRYDMLIAENICKDLVKSTLIEDKEKFVESVRKEFDDSLSMDVQLMLSVSKQLGDQIGQANASQIDRITFLRKCVVLNSNMFGVMRFIPEKDFIPSLVDFMIFDGLTKQEDYKTIVEQTIERKFIEPCKSLKMAYQWERVASICNTFKRIKETRGDFSKLVADVSEVLTAQLQADQANPKRREMRALQVLACR